MKKFKNPHAEPPMMFVNLVVKDLPRSMKFFTDLGYEFNMDFTGESSACLVLGNGNFVMLGTTEIFTTLLGDAAKKVNLPGTGWIALSCSSREEVDRITARAVALGGRTIRPAEDLGFMYSHGFLDFEGNHWGFHWMNPDHKE